MEASTPTNLCHACVFLSLYLHDGGPGVVPFTIRNIGSSWSLNYLKGKKEKNIATKAMANWPQDSEITIMPKISNNRPPSPAPLLVGHIEPRPVDQLVSYVNNARTHSKKQIRQIAASIREFGFVNPILIGPDNRIVAGHARLLAARKLGMQEVPVIILEHLTEAQCSALVLADNQLALNAGWDEELLRAELAALAKEEFALELIGFDDAELKRLLAAQEAAQGLTDPDAAPPLPAVAVSRPSDLWVLGEHRLLCGDAAKRTDVDAVLSGETAAMVFTDPPEGTHAETEQVKFAESLRQACTRLLEVCRGAIYICTPSPDLCQAFIKAGGHQETLLIWAKHRLTAGDSDYQRQYETILYGWAADADHYWCGIETRVMCGSSQARRTIVRTLS